MSFSYHLVCDETKESIWIGQGWDKMESLYYGEEEVMENLLKFLNKNRSPKTLRFIKDDEEYDYSYKKYGDKSDFYYLIIAIYYYIKRKILSKKGEE